MRLALAAIALAAAFAYAVPAAAAPYSVPADNPFVGGAGARDEIWAYGLRNPWRFSFDRQDGDFVLGDVGQDVREEINFIASADMAGGGSGPNFGWNCFEGTGEYDFAPASCAADPPAAVAPVIEYDQNAPSCGGSVTGGYVIRDPAFVGHALAGRYLFGDFCRGQAWSADLGDADPQSTVQEVFRDDGTTFMPDFDLASFGQDDSGVLYAAALGGGEVYKLGPGSEADELALTRFPDASTSFAMPIYVTAPVDDPRVFVVEREGRIQVVEGGVKQAEPFLDLSAQVTSLVPRSERGMLSMAFPPDYDTSGKFYVFYTDAESCDAGDLRVDEFQRSAADPNRADPATQRNVLTIEHTARGNHYGGQLQFGPDAYLYISTGDGGGSGDPDGNGQNLGSLLGKVLRIDPEGDTSFAALDPCPPAPSAGGEDETPVAPPPPVQPSATGQPQPEDSSVERLSLRFARSQRILRQGGVSALVRLGEPARISASGTFRVGDASRLVRLKGVRRSVAGSRRYRIKLRLARRDRRAVAAALRRGRRITVRVRIAARDRAGNRRTLRRSIRARR